MTKILYGQMLKRQPDTSISLISSTIFVNSENKFLVFISELSRAYQGGAEEFFQATCKDELNTLGATRLTVGQVVLELIENPQQRRRYSYTLCARLVCSVFLSSCVSRSLSKPGPLQLYLQTSKGYRINYFRYRLQGLILELYKNTQLNVYSRTTVLASTRGSFVWNDPSTAETENF
jgi:hypothetical protein